MNLEYSVEALADIQEIHVSLVRQSTARASEFYREIDAATERILATPRIGTASPEGIRRIKVRSFPYVVLYQLAHDLIWVVAVAHTSRAPGFWRERLT